MKRLLATSIRLVSGLLLLAGFSFDGLAGTSGGRDEDRRVVAVGDIHGALEELREILASAGLIDERGSWVGGRSIFVQTGDFLDRGAQAAATAEFLKRLQKEAHDAGGEAIILLGNHEAMNLIGDLRYVSPLEYEAFVDDKSEKRRESAAEDYAKFMRRRASRLNQTRPEEDELKRQWLARRPAGYVERMEEFARGDLYRWLRRLPAATRLSDTVFMHGGLHPDLADWSMDRINDRIHKEIEGFAKLKLRLAQEGLILPFFDLKEMEVSVREELDAARAAPFDLRRQERIRLMENFLGTRSWLIRHPDGPLWFRGFANWTEQDEDLVSALLEAWNADRFVVGHNTTASRRIESRFDDRVVLIDTGMLSTHYNGEPAALEIDGGTTRALYARAPRSAPQGKTVAASPPR